MPRKSRNSRTYLEAHASARIFGDALDPSEVSRALELPPDVAVRRGDPHMTRTSRNKVVVYAPYPTGSWRMSSEKWVRSWRLSTHLEWLVAQLEPKSAALAELLAQGVVADLFCFSVGRSSRPPPVPRKLRERALKLGFPINIDHYCDGED